MYLNAFTTLGMGSLQIYIFICRSVSLQLWICLTLTLFQNFTIFIFLPHFIQESFNCYNILFAWKFEVEDYYLPRTCKELQVKSGVSSMCWSRRPGVQTTMFVFLILSCSCFRSYKQTTTTVRVAEKSLASIFIILFLDNGKTGN